MERWTPAFDRLFDRHYELNGGEPFCRTMAWLWLCHHARYADGTQVSGGEALMLKRGEVLCSLRRLGFEWGWSVKKVRTFLAYLHECGKLGTARGTGSGTVYAILQYDVWRGGGTEKGTEKGTSGAQVVEVLENSIASPTAPAREAGSPRSEMESTLTTHVESLPPLVRQTLTAQARMILAGEDRKAWEDERGDVVPEAERPELFKLALGYHSDGRYPSFRSSVRYVVKLYRGQAFPNGNGNGHGKAEQKLMANIAKLRGVDLSEAFR